MYIDPSSKYETFYTNLSLRYDAYFNTTQKYLVVIDTISLFTYTYQNLIYLYRHDRIYWFSLM